MFFLGADSFYCICFPVFPLKVLKQTHRLLFPGTDRCTKNVLLWRRIWQPASALLLGSPVDGGARWAAAPGVTGEADTAERTGAGALGFRQWRVPRQSGWLCCCLAASLPLAGLTHRLCCSQWCLKTVP